MPTRASYNLGATSGFGSSTRMYNFCRQNSPEPWNCINQFINIIPPPVPTPVPGKMKTVFLLELTAGITENDLAMQQTANYYWNNYRYRVGVADWVVSDQMALIPQSVFQMGDSRIEWKDALPIHSVDVSSFAIEKTEVMMQKATKDEERESPKIYINENLLKVSHKFKYLGCQLQDDATNSA